jgi:predicted ArsR family transcriptional regulator
MEGSILELLEEHGSLGYEQIAALLGERPDEVRNSLTDLRESGLVDAFSLGELQAPTATAASYWRLTDRGREELERRRSG